MGLAFLKLNKFSWKTTSLKRNYPEQGDQLRGIIGNFDGQKVISFEKTFFYHFLQLLDEGVKVPIDI